jgi:archaeosine synthase beta-subunit
VSGRREAGGVDQRIRGLRQPKPKVDPYAAHGSLLEPERRPGGKIEQALTVFLTGAECPFTCSFCDLWRYTIDGPTPPGALTKQLQAILASTDITAVDRIKLYNASNFFDTRAVPAEDFSGLAKLASVFQAMTVESHASMIGARTLDLARRIDGRLEVAVGLETIHPVGSAQLNKRLDLHTFDKAATFLADNDIDLRVFVLLGAPYVPATESVEWTVRTAEYAVDRGASIVSIIPVRGGNGEMDRLQTLGEFTPPLLSDLETVLDRFAGLGEAVVTADLWDVERLIGCDECAPHRIARLRRSNLTGVKESRIVCDACGVTTA